MNIIKNLKRLSFAVSSFALLAISNVSAADPISLWEGDNLAAVLEKIVTNILTWAGALCVLMIIWGGLTYMTAGADTKGVENGKNIVKAALIGLVIILAAAMVIAFVQKLNS